MTGGDNRLTVLAAEIRSAHAGVEEAARTAAERALDAGMWLIEAKDLVKHGEWLPWLQDHCQLSERTAQLYMHIAKLGLKSELVADLGLKMAARVVVQIHDDTYNPFYGIDDEQQRQWLLFCWFGIPWQHAEWLRNQQFETPDEWLGPIGREYRSRFGWRDLSPSWLKRWREFQEEHRHTTREAIEAGVATVEGEREEACASHRYQRPRAARRRPA